MEKIQVNTTQNVNLEYSAAGVGLRILAGLLDTLFVYTYIIILVTVFTNFVIRKNVYSGNFNENESFNQAMIGLLILFLLPAFVYHLLCETFLNGQSFGKKIVKIKVIKLNGTQPNFGTYLIRSMFRIIDRPLIAILAVAVSEKSQRFGDMVAGTTVIHLNKKVSINETILNRMQSNYKIQYSQVAMLSDKDANIIKEVLKFSALQEQREHLKLLREKIQNKYGIHNPQQNDVDFFNTLLNDYTHYKFEN
ncbi:MAG: RDD family protein [Sphingobacteriaceae bacterium]|nr:RDD family protein [Sphingobacteriaceae bacterium]